VRLINCYIIIIIRGGHNGIASHKPPNPQYETNDSRKSNEAATKSKPNEPRFRDSNKVVCYYCKKPGHTLAVCRKRLAKLMDSGTSGDTSVQLTSTLNKTQIESSVKQNVD